MIAGSKRKKTEMVGIEILDPQIQTGARWRSLKIGTSAMIRYRLILSE